MPRSLALFAFLLTGCPDAAVVVPEPFSGCRTSDGHDFEIVAMDTAGAPASIDGDTLWVDVGYGGGCEEHSFVVCWDSAFDESDPVQVNLELFHGGVADACEAYIYETLELDLTPLKDAWHTSYGTGAGTITIHLAGYGESLEYTFE